MRATRACSVDHCANPWQICLIPGLRFFHILLGEARQAAFLSGQHTARTPRRFGLRNTRVELDSVIVAFAGWSRTGYGARFRFVQTGETG